MGRKKKSTRSVKTYLCPIHKTELSTMSRQSKKYLYCQECDGIHTTADLREQKSYIVKEVPK